MTTRPEGRRGQAVILVTFALIAMCGLLGLAVDLGWAYFVKKSAQASADAAALASAHFVLGQIGQTQDFQSEFAYGSGTCASEGEDFGLSNGCAYGQQSGFSGTVSMTSGVYSVPPTVSNMSSAFYWVTARSVQSIPQLFSAVLGNPTGISSARATAAVVTQSINGALHTLNRQYDNIAALGWQPGTDVSGGGSIIVPSGLVISSQSANAGAGPSVTGPITIVSPGNASALGGSSITDIGDSGEFLDPYRDIPQPILPSNNVLAGIGGTGTLHTYGVVNGNPISVYQIVAGTATLGPAVPAPYPSGNYVPITCGIPCATGGTATPSGQITLTQNTVFSDPTPTCYPTSSSNFGCFLFYGGLTVSSGATMTMGAGEFVMVGGGSSGMDFAVSSGAFLDSQVTCTNPSACSTAGIILIMTGTSSAITCSSATRTNANGDLYPSLCNQINSNPVLVNAATMTTMLNFGAVSLLAGADSSSKAVTGLVARNLPSSVLTNLNFTLAPFDGVVLWQDQANSTIVYQSNGNINVSCGNIDNPCTKTLVAPSSAGMTLQASSGTGIQGIVYQPRGGFLQTGGGSIQGPLQIITGAVSMGGGTINITQPPTSAKRRAVALVE
jgi:hypothetical protein